MGFRVVDKTSFTFETDLPPSCRNIHPSGIVYALRSTPPAPTTTSDATATSDDNKTAIHREEHIFAWIANSLHIEAAVVHLEKNGFDREDGIVFIPYSTQRNWQDRYPHAEPALVVDEMGKCTVHMTKRPYPNGLGRLSNEGGSVAPAFSVESFDLASGDAADGAKTKSKKRKYPSRKAIVNMLQDESFIPDAERDELHIEIYNYMKWLHVKLAALEKKGEEELAEQEDAANSPKKESDENLLAAENSAAAAGAASAATAKEDEDGNNNDPTLDSIGRKKPPPNLMKYKVGVDVAELNIACLQLESTFAIINNMKKELTAVGMEDEEEEVVPQKGAPFLEEALSSSLSRLVAAREVGGKAKRRSRKWRKRPKGVYGDPRRESRGHDRKGVHFDIMFEKLVKYKEEHGDCQVNKKYHDKKLAMWVKNIREKKAKLVKAGIEYEVLEPGQKMLPRTLTKERIERMTNIGFVWVCSTGPNTPWEDRFQELLEYYEENGRWPSQSMGTLGQWVHKQRQKYTRREPKYMKERAPKLDEVGFEWTPRGNTKLTWDEGFEMLMAFGRINGHYNVQAPAGDNVDLKSGEYRLYKWVESLHAMYRSYKLGRQSGSLSEERILLLIKQGFEFRND